MVRRASLSIIMVKTTYIGTAEEETEARDTYVERACTREEHKMRLLRVRDGTQILASGGSAHDRFWPVAGAHGVALEAWLGECGA